MEPIQVMHPELNDTRAPMDRFKAAELALVDERIASGDLISADDLCCRLGWSSDALDAAIGANKIFGIVTQAGSTVFPVFYCDRSLRLDLLMGVSAALGAMPGPSKWQFFTTRKQSLNGATALESLAAGNVDAVIVAAAGFAGR